MKFASASLLSLMIGVFGSATTLAGEVNFGGHLKLWHSASDFPTDSFYSDHTIGGNFGDISLSAFDLRSNIEIKHNRWDAEINYQWSTLTANKDGYFNTSSATPFNVEPVINDDIRVFDLTNTTTKGNLAALHRLDRLNIGYTSDNAVLRIGRQAVSWGNGLAYSPMDIFNPFDPSAVDTEYKTGDDMIYGQWLLTSGNDWQLVAVPRRDPNTGNIKQASSSIAAKYHAVTDAREFDLLLAQHYDESIIGVGLVSHLGSAITRADLTATRSDSDWIASAVASLSYSWVWGQRNWSGSAELYYNGFGINKEQLSVTSIINEPALLDRLQRGELYTLGRYYAAMLSTVEISPRLMLNPNLFMNLKDQSGLLQISANYDWLQNADIVISINTPFGDDGSEFGGIEVPVLTENGIQPSFLKTNYQLFAQLSMYF